MKKKPRPSKKPPEAFYLIKLADGYTKTQDDGAIYITPHKDGADIYNKKNAAKTIQALRDNGIYGAKKYRMKKGIIVGDA